MPGQKSTFKILACTQGGVHPEVNQVIELAGRTCYKSLDKITDGSAEKFIKMLLTRGHESVIEHSWFVFAIDKNKFDREKINRELVEIFLANNLLVLTENENYFLLSGNARMFRDLFKKLPAPGEIADAMISELRQAAPIIFEDIGYQSIKNQETQHTFLCPNSFPFSDQEKLKHFWLAVRLNGCSRAFTHQLVRHRRAAYSQESQRYCDESGFFKNEYYVLPPAIEQNNLASDYIKIMEKIDNDYQELREKLRPAKAGLANEDARFVLPNAVCSEIVISANLEQWQQIFKVRCDIHAQWEIREIMTRLREEVKKIFPSIFDKDENL